jgi:uncharacterized protein (TIGR02421 family)
MRRVAPEPALEAVAAARREIEGDDVVAKWLRGTADAIEAGAHMLAAVGTAEFSVQSARLYGTPTQERTDGVGNSLDLAHNVREVVEATSAVDLGAPPPACHIASAVAARLSEAVQRFGADAPEVVVVDELSANALAGPRAIRVRRTACFTDLDAEQLIQHEAFVHVATSLNGRAQEDLPILAAGHPGTTRTQEGLAVFAELISGVMDPDRLLRLADRVAAVQKAIDGADFLDVYRFFLERSDDPSQSFENARRVFRGGVLEGGAPFTKDVVYLDGLLRVTNFLRAAVSAGRADCVRLLFCGKMDLEDLPAISVLFEAGLCRPPRHLPPWCEDLRFLVASLAFSAFLNRVDLDRVRGHYQDLLARSPVGNAGSVGGSAR